MTDHQEAKRLQSTVACLVAEKMTAEATITDLRGQVDRLASRAELADTARDAACAALVEARSKLERSEGIRKNLALTIGACPEGHHDANLAHARAERDRLRAELAEVRNYLANLDRGASVIEVTTAITTMLGGDNRG